MQHPSMITPKLMLSTLEQLRLEIGIGGPLGDLPMDVIAPYLTECWWKDLLLYLFTHDIQLHTDKAELPLNTRYDRYLMDIFISYHDYETIGHRLAC